MVDCAGARNGNVIAGDVSPLMAVWNGGMGFATLMGGMDAMETLQSVGGTGVRLTRVVSL